MNISFINVPEEEHQRYIEATTFYSRILMDEEIYKELNIEIHLSDEFESLGQTLNDDFMTDRPQYFRIELRSQESDVEPLYTLAHEITHVKQYAMGELTLDFVSENINKLDTSNIKVKPMWMGKHVSFREYESAYWDSPWEIEAYGRQDSMYDRFLDFERIIA